MFSVKGKNIIVTGASGVIARTNTVSGKPVVFMIPEETFRKEVVAVVVSSLKFY